jgi:hypothetical protein
VGADDVIIWIILLLSALAGAAVARAKGRRALDGAVLGAFLSVLGLLIVALLLKARPQVTTDAEGHEQRHQPGRLDWLIGGSSGAGASIPAMVLSLLALAVAGFGAYQWAQGAFNRIDDKVLEQTIADDLVDQGASGVFVDCPRRARAAPGSVLLCDVRYDQQTGLARVTVENSQGDVAWTIMND